ncbi:MAG: hypothetical protein RE471_06305 [Ferroplasma sp.]|uniref:hypothetical protein n=1 Tax=Ferroplasma sp. TaxID=2591003 RepID=UPI0028158FDD|nr:hypothetical protein [Ferroplasma sp.]WMT50591.1 MAG: hypothetical protein RE471_06305 [Ferroplasma sp.]
MGNRELLPGEEGCKGEDTFTSYGLKAFSLLHFSADVIIRGFFLILLEGQQDLDGLLSWTLSSPWAGVN